MFAKASTRLDNGEAIVYYKVPQDQQFEVVPGLSIHKMDKNTFIPMRALMNEHCVYFDSYDSSDGVIAGSPKLGIISSVDKEGNPDLSTVNGVTTFTFLHLIATLEASDKPYAERIAQLEKAYVKNEPSGKVLTIAGKYFAIAKFTNVDDPKFRRVLILEPASYTYRDAILSLMDLKKATDRSSTDGERFGSLDEKKSLLSPYCQMKLLTRMFDVLGVVHSDGNLGDPSSEGVLPWVMQTLEFLRQHNNSNRSAKLIVAVESVIAEYKKNDRPFSMQFISDLIRKSHYFGMLLLEHNLRLENASSELKIRNAVTGSKDTFIDSGFNLDEVAYRDLGGHYQNVSFEIGDGVKYTTKRMYADSSLLSYMGLSGRMIEHSKVVFKDSLFTSAVQMSDEQARLSHIAASFEGVEMKEESEMSAPKPTTESFAELRELFNPDVDCVYNFKSVSDGGPKAFYKKVLPRAVYESKEGKYMYRTYPSEANGFVIQAGDTIQLFGDVTHTYHVESVVRQKVTKNGKTTYKTVKIKLDQRDGVDCTYNKALNECKPSDISAIVSREIPTDYSEEELKQHDYYQSKEWKAKASDAIDRTKNAKKITSLSEFEGTRDMMVNVAKDAKVVLFYPVRNSDESIFTILEKLQKDIEEGKAPSEAEFIPVNTAIDPAILDDEAAVEDARDEFTKRMKEAVEQLRTVENLNGIVVIPLKGTNASVWGNPDQAAKIPMLKSIKESYVAKYISFTSEPKFNAKTKAKRVTKAEPALAAPVAAIAAPKAAEVAAPIAAPKAAAEPKEVVKKPKDKVEEIVKSGTDFATIRD